MVADSRAALTFFLSSVPPFLNPWKVLCDLLVTVTSWQQTKLPDLVAGIRVLHEENSHVMMKMHFLQSTVDYLEDKLIFLLNHLFTLV